MLEAVKNIKAILTKPSKIFVVAHRNPDGDAIGSVLAMRRFLEKLGHSVQVAFPSAYPDFFDWVEGIEDILIYDSAREKVKKVVGESEVFFILDLNSLSRLDEMGELMAKNAGPKVLVDHHLFPELASFDVAISDTSASSTCELVYELVAAWDQSLIDEVMATHLYIGILTDTGTFSYSTSTRLFENVAKLLDSTSIDHITIQNKINNNIPEKSVRLLGFCLAQRMELLPEYGTGIIYLTQRDFANWRIKRGDTEGIVNYILKIKGYNVAAFFTDQRTIIKISLRSLGDFSVEQIAKAHFSGGGHKNASGGQSNLTLEETINKFKEVLPSYFKNEAVTV